MELSQDVKDKLCNIDNNKCLIVEFSNDFDNSGKPYIQTGFAAWLLEETEDIDNIINTEQEVLIYWPNCDIVSAAALKKKLKLCSFKKQSVKIKARGEWKSMRQKEQNLINYDLISPTKESRKELKRKKIGDNEEEPCPLVKRSKSINKTDPINEIILCTMEQNLSQISYEDNDTDPLDLDLSNDNHKLDNDSHNDNDNDSDNDNDKGKDKGKDKDKDKDKDKHKDKDYDDEEEIKNDEDSEDDEVEEEDVLLTMLNDKDKKLEDNSKEIEKLSNKVEDLEKKLQQEKRLSTHLKEKIAKLEETIYLETSRNEKNIEYERFTKAVYEDLMSVKSVVDNRLQNLSCVASTSTCLKDVKNIPVERKTKIPKNRSEGDENEHPIHEFLDNSDAHLEPQCTDSKSKSTKPKKKPKYGKEDTTYVISEEVLQKVPKKNIKLFSNILIDLLFTKQELAASSVTGIASNANKDQDVRPALDEQKMAAARNLCYQYFGEKQKNWRGTFHYIAKNKCGDARKSLE